MFLVYDGGHSISEVLWAASAIEEGLQLPFSFKSSEHDHHFIPDLRKLTDLLSPDPELLDAWSQALESAFDGSLEKMQKFSPQDPLGEYLPTF